MWPFTLSPAMNRNTAPPLPLLSPGAAGDRALRPGGPVQPLTFHCEHNHRDAQREKERDAKVRTKYESPDMEKDRKEKDIEVRDRNEHSKRTVGGTDRETGYTAGLFVGLKLKMILTYPHTNLNLILFGDKPM